MALLDEVENGTFIFWCEGCQKKHAVWTNKNSNPRWNFNQNLDCPTFTPSLLVKGIKYEKDIEGKPIQGTERDAICHLFITDGKIQYLGDSHHHLAGKTIEMQHLKDVL